MALKGIKVLEIAGLAPVPFCGMLLADFGATVTRVDKVSGNLPDPLGRGKRSIAVDIKKPEGREIVLNLAAKSDVLIEPFRPGVMERLGLGPTDLLSSNKRLIYARISGYGQNGPLKSAAGHDINYLSYSGLLSCFGRSEERPSPPVNLVADFGGGGLLCAYAILAAILERQSSGRGQTEGASYLGSFIFASQGSDLIWPQPMKRGKNLLDSGFPLYEVYETKDGKFISVGALEPQFQAAFFSRIGDEISPESILSDPIQGKQLLQSQFLQKTRDEWVAVFQDVDACVAPVLSLEEASVHGQQNTGSFQGHLPKPCPRMSRTPPETDFKLPAVGQHTKEELGNELGMSPTQLEELEKKSIIASHDVNLKSKL